MRVAAILTCHNRKEKTLACLRSLIPVIPFVDVFLTDDGCTDGTSDAVLQEFPLTTIIYGKGDLFWSRGMYCAWKEALPGNYDFYLWLNDDIVLLPSFFVELMECFQLGGENCIIVGLVKDTASGSIIYGGTGKDGRLVQESMFPQPLVNMNGNIVLVPRSIVERIGIIDPVYWHDIGDVDYGLVASENGIPVLSTREAVAFGFNNGKICRVRKWGATIGQRFSRLYSPLGAKPSILFYFYRKHKGLLRACLFVLYLHIINILPDSFVRFVWGEKYVEHNPTI